jgi:peptide/nickel transport system ATP-binding protein
MNSRSQINPGKVIPDAIAEDELLKVSDLKRHFPIKRGVFKRIVGWTKAVDGVSFSIRKGETLGLVGESGCGKTTTGRSILRIGGDPTSGRALYNDGGEGVDITQLDFSEMKPYRRKIQIVFQDPRASLDPRMTVENIISEPLRIQGANNRKDMRERISALLLDVGLRPVHMNRYPHEFSGGQRQRIGIARALALEPELLVCDEPVSALDVSVQAQVIELFEDLQDRMGLTYLFIAHDLSVVEHISDRVAVMYLGKIVELATSESLYFEPKHPYSEALLSAVPKPDPDIRSEKILLEGDVPDPSNPPSGCRFHPRCRYANEVCMTEEPDLVPVKSDPEHLAACHFSNTLALKGMPEG